MFFNKKIGFAVSLVTISTLEQSSAALFWNNIVINDAGTGTVQNTDLGNTAIWGDGASATAFQNTNTIINNTTSGSFTAVTNPVNINQTFQNLNGNQPYSTVADQFDAGVNSAFTFSFEIVGGGTADLGFTAIGGGPFNNSSPFDNDWFRIVIDDIQGNVTQVNYSVTFNQAFRGLDTDPNNAALAFGVRGTESGSTLNYSVLDADLDPINLQNATFAVTAPAAAGAPQIADDGVGNVFFSAPDNNGANTTTAVETITTPQAGNNAEGLGLNHLGANHLDDRIGGFEGSFTDTSFSSGAVFAFTLNGVFETDTQVVPEPSAPITAAITSSMLLLYRRRSHK